MPPLRRVSLALALAAAATTALASCGGGGGSDLLPGTTADQINSNLDEVQALVNQGECIGAEDAVAEVAAEVEDLKGVNGKLQAALEEGAAQLGQVVTECDETSEETEPSLESDVEAGELEREEREAEEKAEKAAGKAEKHGKGPSEEAAEESEGEVGGNLPPQSNGKAKGHEPPPPPSEPAEEAPSGGVGPGVGVEE